MSSLFNFEQSDQKFITKLSGMKDREKAVARLSKGRRLMFWLLCLICIVSVLEFVLTCREGSPRFQVFVSSLPGLALFGIVDMQIKTLKLLQKYEQEPASTN